MKRVIAASFILLAGAFMPPALAQIEEHGVPIAYAPFHVPVFKNEYVMLLNVDVPPQRDTGYHTHSLDSVSVNVEDADVVNQNLGGPPGAKRHSKRGEAAFVAYSKEPPRTHKASNVGQTPFHNIAFNFLSSRPSGFTPGSRTGVAGYTQIMDNERVTGWRLILEPGQSAAAITQKAPGLRIVLESGIIAENVPGQPERGMNLHTAEFFWQDAGTTRAIKNTGMTRVEFLEFELK